GWDQAQRALGRVRGDLRRQAGEEGEPARPAKGDLCHRHVCVPLVLRARGDERGGLRRDQALAVLSVSGAGLRDGKHRGGRDLCELHRGHRELRAGLRGVHGLEDLRQRGHHLCHGHRPVRGLCDPFRRRLFGMPRREQRGPRPVHGHEDGRVGGVWGGFLCWRGGVHDVLQELVPHQVWEIVICFVISVSVVTSLVFFSALLLVAGPSGQ
ncbi:unnamed protein product, partial [Effrenium voratum]